MLGAFGVSVSTIDWSSEFRDTVALEIQRYKSVRHMIAQGKQYRLFPQSDLSLPHLELPAEPDAIEFYDPLSQRGVAFLFLGKVPWSERRVVFRGLEVNMTYRVTLADGTIVAQRTGRQLMTQNIRLPVAVENPSVLLFIQPVNPGLLNNASSSTLSP
jgi:alpha-galactosidase